MIIKTPKKLIEAALPRKARQEAVSIWWGGCSACPARTAFVDPDSSVGRKVISD